jgi:hypothetical protein
MFGTDKKEVEVFVNRSDIRQLEISLAKAVGTLLYTDSWDRQMDLLVSEIGKSVFSLKQIEDYVLRHPQHIQRMATSFFKDEQPESLGVGISIKYAIYLLYLRENDEDVLRDYLKTIRLPRGAQRELFVQLQQIKKDLSN